MNSIWLAARAANGEPDPLRYTSAAAEGNAAAVLLKNGPGRLYGATVEIISATQYWLHVIDKATTPVGGEVPIYRKRLTPNGSVDLPPWLSLFGIYCANRIYLAISSTAPTTTFAVANDMLVTAHYR